MTVLAQSSQPGGDGYAIVLNVMQGAVQDIIADEVSGSGPMEKRAAVDLKADDFADTDSTGVLYAQRSSLVEVPCVEDVQWYFSAPSFFQEIYARPMMVDWSSSCAHQTTVVALG